MRITANLDIVGLKISYQYTLRYEAKDQATVADLKLEAIRRLVSVLAHRDEDSSIQIESIQFKDSQFQILADTVKLSSLNPTSGVADCVLSGAVNISPLDSPKHQMHRSLSRRTLEKKRQKIEIMPAIKLAVGLDIDADGDYMGVTKVYISCLNENILMPVTKALADKSFNVNEAKAEISIFVSKRSENHPEHQGEFQSSHRGYSILETLKEVSLLLSALKKSSKQPLQISCSINKYLEKLNSINPGTLAMLMINRCHEEYMEFMHSNFTINYALLEKSLRQFADQSIFNAQEIPEIEPLNAEADEVFDADSEQESSAEDSDIDRELGEADASETEESESEIEYEIAVSAAIKPKPLWQSIWSGLKWIVGGLLNCLCCCFIRKQAEPEQNSPIGARNTGDLIQRLLGDLVKTGAKAKSTAKSTSTLSTPFSLSRTGSLGVLTKNRSLERLHRKERKARKEKDGGGVQFKVK